MLARELEVDCTRCHGSGRVQSRMFTALCGCPAGRALAILAWNGKQLRDPQVRR